MKISDLFAKRVRKGDSPTSSRTVYNYSGGTPINPHSSMEVSAYYRGVMYISTQMAKLPINILDADNQAQDSTISYLINKQPNPEMTAYTFKLLMWQIAINYGNAYAEIERDVVGRVVNLWPLPPSSITPVRAKEDNRLLYRVSNGSFDGKDVYLEPRDIFHFKNFHTLDGLVGQSLIGFAKDTLGIAKGADIMANSLFANSGAPSGALQVEGRLSPDAVGRIKEQWQVSNGGRKAGGVVVLEEGVTFNQIAMNPDVMQFLESRKFSVLEIARFLGLPPTKLFDNETATYNNVEQANLEVATDTLDAWARNFESEIDSKLLPRRSKYRSEMDLYAVFRGDMETRSQYFTRMMQTAAITPNEIRKKEGLPPYQNGDRFFVATNNFTPADRIDEVLDSQVQGKENSQSAEQKKQEEEAAMNKVIAEYLTRN